MENGHRLPNSTEQRPSTAPGVRDRRVPPRGGLPRQLQTWLMLAIAALILGIILVTGYRQAPAGPGPVERVTDPALAPADRIRQFERQLGDDETRLRQQAGRVPDAVPQAVASRSGSQTANPQLDELERRPDQTLFADNVAFSQRAGRRAGPWEPDYPPTGPMGSPLPTPTPEELEQLAQALMTLAPGAYQPPAMPTPPPTPVEPAPPEARSEPQVRLETPVHSAPGTDRIRLVEGTIIETVLLTRLDGTFAGPVACMVTTPVFSRDGQRLVVPAGARVLGSAAPVQAWGDSRLAVSFHRLLMPNGRTHSLERFMGLTQSGETGLRDRVDRHYLQLFGASLAIGALSGLAQFNTRSGFDVGFADAYRQSAGASMATSTSRVLDRYLNVLPTVTIREGYRIKVYLTNDLDLPPYDPAPGGAR